jgi:hypothetical protein
MAIMLGTELGNPPSRVNVSESFEGGDENMAVQQVLLEARRLNSDQDFQDQRKKSQDSILRDIQRYKAHGGQNWAGD